MAAGGATNAQASEQIGVDPMSTTETKLLTAEEFWLLPGTEMRRSLVRGEVVEEMPVGGEHGGLAVLFVLNLGLWAREHDAGWVGVETGFILARGPDLIRAPDVSFVRKEHLPADGAPRTFWELAPDLAVEIVSPSETAIEVRDKVADYLAAGTPLVLVAYPARREIVAHTPDDLARTYHADDTLTAPDVLPGFARPVRDFFA
jgi:Uma2 family endonuclease